MLAQTLHQAYAAPLLGASSLGAAATVALALSVGRFGLTALTAAQCIAGPVLAACWATVLATLALQVLRVLRAARLPLQKQAEPMTRVAKTKPQIAAFSPHQRTWCHPKHLEKAFL